MLGLLWESTIEVNKRLWTPSFVLVTGAISIGLILAAHLTVDRSRVAATIATPLTALGRNALLVYVGQHVVGVWLSRVHVGVGHRVDVAHRACRATMGRTTGRVLRLCTRDAHGLDAPRVRAARPSLVRDAVRRRLESAVAALVASCLVAASCSTDGGSGASSTAAGSSTTATANGGSSTTNPSSRRPTVLLDMPDPALSALPTDDLPTGVAAGSPAAERGDAVVDPPELDIERARGARVRDPGDRRRAADSGGAARVARPEDPVHRHPAPRRRVRGVVDGRERHDALHRVHPPDPGRALELLRRQRHLSAAGRPRGAIPAASAVHG